MIADMPAGAIGFRASGEVTRDEYRDVLAPAMREAADSGEIRLLFVVAEGFEEIRAGAMMEDAKAGLDLGIFKHSAWRRTALVTEVEWIAKGTRAFAWMAPGEVKVFPLAEEPQARTWVVG